MRVVDTATLAGDGDNNQDRAITGDRYAAVLDGASQFPPRADGHDGGWYSERLARALTHALDADPESTPSDAVAHAIGSVATDEHLQPGDAPSSTVTLARWDAERLHIYVLGDSPAIVFLTDGTHQVITDRRLSQIADDRRTAYRARLADGHGFDATHRRLLADLQAEQQRQRNNNGGYWIAEADPQAGHHGYTTTFALDHIDTVLLLSDGVSATVDKYASPQTWPEALTYIRDHGCAALLRAATELEDQDHDGSKWPRSKRHDDKTAVLVAAKE
ncbi:protein phosphatase 2C family protein [Nocardioidaceae bacterium SCSIO 66511]|nr:protein phosphatase 2C family protein [Nocardioidaceae bacterium SCSIO 66511]